MKPAMVLGALDELYQISIRQLVPRSGVADSIADNTASGGVQFIPALGIDLTGNCSTQRRYACKNMFRQRLHPTGGRQRQRVYCIAR